MGDDDGVAITGSVEMSGAPAMELKLWQFVSYSRSAEPGAEKKLVSNRMSLVDHWLYTEVEDGELIETPWTGDAWDLDDFHLDIASQWDDWEIGARKIIFVGAADVEGERLHHYVLFLDTSALAGADTVGMPPEVTYDVWLDDQDFMRLVTSDLHGTENVLKFDDWGEPLDITAPPASGISVLSEMPNDTGGTPRP